MLKMHRVSKEYIYKLFDDFELEENAENKSLLQKQLINSYLQCPL